MTPMRENSDNRVPAILPPEDVMHGLVTAGSDLTDVEFRVLAIIATAHNRDTGDSRLSQPEIAQYAGRSVRTVQRTIDKLVADGHLIIKLPGVGRGNAAAYVLAIGAPSQLAG